MVAINKMCKGCPYRKGDPSGFEELGIHSENATEWFDGDPVHSCHEIGFGLEIYDEYKDKKVGCKGSVLFYEKMNGKKHKNIKDFNEMIKV